MSSVQLTNVSFASSICSYSYKHIVRKHCDTNLKPGSVSLSDGPQTFFPDWHILTTIGWVELKFLTDILGRQRRGDYEWLWWFMDFFSSFYGQVKCLDNCWMNWHVLNAFLRIACNNRDDLSTSTFRSKFYWSKFLDFWSKSCTNDISIRLC